MEILFSKLHISIAAAILTYAIIWYSRRKRCLPYPPGPPSDPLFGHIRFLPTTVDDETLLWWHEKYGM